MKFKLRRSTALLQARRRSLLAAYDDEELHQLRIALRRIRSALGPLTAKNARNLRRDFGKLARASNPARDWDTLLASAQNELAPMQFDELQSRLRAGQADAREDVLRLLDSKAWKSALKRWKKYSHRPEMRQRNEATTRADLRQVMLNTTAALRKAAAKDDARHWHRLRIAIKALRYTLESQPGAGCDSPTTELIDCCKRLQTKLGDWHDTSVHRQLLASACGGTLTAAQDTARAALQEALAERGRRCLDQVKAEIGSGEIGGLAALAEGLTPGDGVSSSRR
jgi:CHAD domain-containing protein